MSEGKIYHVNDGRLVLALEEDPGGGYAVTCPTDPELITQAETISEAFELAHELKAELAEMRKELLDKLDVAG
ncbi:MAG: type II toxin-antitoxin system HicB family antitoxin [Planctomycetota bacterium]